MWLTKQKLQQGDSERLKHKRINKFYQAYGNKERTEVLVSVKVKVKL